MGEEEAWVLGGGGVGLCKEKKKKLSYVHTTSPPWVKGEGRSDWCSDKAAWREIRGHWFDPWWGGVDLC